MPTENHGTAFSMTSMAPSILGALPDELNFAVPIGPALAVQQSGFKERIATAIWDVVDQLDWILSATFTGSFLLDDDLERISDIDLVLIVDRLNAARFKAIQLACEKALAHLMQEIGYNLQINAALGPLKINAPQTAVLHLMLYDKAAHVEHAVQSPFTCYDWQRSTVFRKQSMAAVYPVFALQPHHFVNKRRSVRDYLHDYRAGVMSYRELKCDDKNYREEKCQRPMTVRCRHEFAYHILRFLMQNLLKLVERHNNSHSDEKLAQAYTRLFPLDAEDVWRLYAELTAKKKSGDFAWPAPDLDRRLESFVANFESQFRRIFFTEATRHIVFRHAPTLMNAGTGENRRFVGRSNPEILPVEDARLELILRAIPAEEINEAFISPLLRCQQTYELLRRKVPLPEPIIDNRLLEIDYGRCEGQTVAVSRSTFPDLFAAWQRGEDLSFPDGEAADDVARRALAFVDDRWPHADSATITCTHNTVVRTLLGQALGVPRKWWHRLQIPHLEPITFLQTQSHGWFVDLEEDVERQVFAEFAREA